MYEIKTRERALRILKSVKSFLAKVGLCARWWSNGAPFCSNVSNNASATIENYDLFSSRLQASKGKRRPCKTVQNQALFFHPASSPFIIRIIIVITIIVANVLFEHTFSEQLFQRHSPLKSQKKKTQQNKTDICYYSPAAQKHKRHLSAKHLSKVTNVRIYISISSGGLESIQWSAFSPSS